MKIKLLGQLRDQASTIKQVGDNVLEIDGKVFSFPQDIAKFDPVDGFITEAFRDDAGNLFVTAVVGYDQSQRTEFETIDPESGTWRHGVGYEDPPVGQQDNSIPVIQLSGKTALDILKVFQEELCDRVESQVGALLDYGFNFSGHRYPADVQAQTSAMQQWDWYKKTGNVTLLGFKAKDAGWIPMDETTFNAFEEAGREFVMNIYQNVWTTKALIRAATTRQDSQMAFDAGGWK